MFALNEKVVYPGHGVAKISRIVEKSIGNDKVLFYELTFVNKDMTILVPILNSENAGVRCLSSKDSIQDLLKIFLEPLKRVQNYEFNSTNWNKRNKEYLTKLRIGSLKGILEIYRDLSFVSTYKELSFGEKNLFMQTENLLIEEISLVRNLDRKIVEEELRSLCTILKPKDSIKEYKRA